MNDFTSRQNWSKQCENQLNSQINLELFASHQYLYLSSHFDRDDIALKQLSDYYMKASIEEREHANLFIEYQNKRGGIVNLTNVNSPQILEDSANNSNYVIESFKTALNLEKKVNNSLFELHNIAGENNDAQFSDFIEGTFLSEQVDGISEISKYITQLEFIGDNKYGIWDFVKQL